MSFKSSNMIGPMIFIGQISYPNELPLLSEIYRWNSKDLGVGRQLPDVLGLFYYKISKDASAPPVPIGFPHLLPKWIIVR